MPHTERLHTTVTASLGIVTSVASSVAASLAEELRKGPRAALRLPMSAMSTGLAVSTKVRQELTDALRQRMGGAEDNGADGFVSAFDRITDDTRDLVTNGSGPTAADEEPPPAEAPKAAPTPKRPRKATTGPRSARPAAGPAGGGPDRTPGAPTLAPVPPIAPLVPAEAEVPAEVAAAAGEVVDHDELPLPDFDHMTLGQLRGRLRSLDLVSLVQLRDYEEAHANRLPIIAMLNNRITKVQADGTADGSPQPAAPGAVPPASPGTDTVTPATSGPPINPPTAGDPTNPAQPRS